MSVIYLRTFSPVAVGTGRANGQYPARGLLTDVSKRIQNLVDWEG